MKTPKSIKLNKGFTRSISKWFEITDSERNQVRFCRKEIPLKKMANKLDVKPKDVIIGVYQRHPDEPFIFEFLAYKMANLVDIKEVILHMEIKEKGGNKTKFKVVCESLKDLLGYIDNYGKRPDADGIMRIDEAVYGNNGDAAGRTIKISKVKVTMNDGKSKTFKSYGKFCGKMMGHVPA